MAGILVSTQDSEGTSMPNPDVDIAYEALASHCNVVADVASSGEAVYVSQSRAQSTAQTIWAAAAGYM